MQIRIKSKDFNLYLPVPLFMGGTIIRCIPNEKLNKEQKKIALKLFKTVKGSLKEYKGLEILEVISKDGEHISIKIWWKSNNKRYYHKKNKLEFMKENHNEKIRV